MTLSNAMPQISDLRYAKLSLASLDLLNNSRVVLRNVISSVPEDNHIINICFTILKICDAFVDKAPESSRWIFSHQRAWACQRNLPESS